MKWILLSFVKNLKPYIKNIYIFWCLRYILEDLDYYYILKCHSLKYLLIEANNSILLEYSKLNLIIKSVSSHMGLNTLVNEYPWLNVILRT